MCTFCLFSLNIFPLFCYCNFIKFFNWCVCFCVFMNFAFWVCVFVWLNIECLNNDQVYSPKFNNILGFANFISIHLKYPSILPDFFSFIQLDFSAEFSLELFVFQCLNRCRKTEIRFFKISDIAKYKNHKMFHSTSSFLSF